MTDTLHAATDTHDPKVRVVSTFNVSHAGAYGERFLRSCGEHGVPLTLVCYEPFDSVPCYGETRLDATRGGEHEDADLWRWRELTAEYRDGGNYRYQMRRFAWKVFAYTRPELRTADWLVWLDADLTITGRPSWDYVLLSQVDVSYLGRSQWDHSECGFIAWNLKSRGGECLDELRRRYVAHEVQGAEQQHDSWIFDRVRDELDLDCLNISPAARGLDAWSASPLAAWSVHHKGLEKFASVR